MNKKGKIVLLFLMVLSFFLTTGYTSFNANPQTVYRVYLKGKSLGIIESKDSFEDYIDQKQEEIKTKYSVKKVYVPSDLDIVKEITFETDI